MWSSTPSTAKAEPSHKDGAMQFAPVQLVDVVSAVVHDLDASGSRVQVVIGRTPTVLGDPAKLADVTKHLVASALSAAPQDGLVEVEVAGRCLEHAGQDAAEATDACSANASVAIRSPRTDADLVGTTANRPSLAGSEHIVRRHQGRLWASVQRGQKTVGFCIESGRTA